jgi:O-antigen ligase
MLNTERTIEGLKLTALCIFAFSVVFSVSAVEAALFLTLAALIAGEYRQGTLLAKLRGLAKHPLFIPWAIYLGVCLLSACLAFFPKKAFGQLNSDFLKYVCLAGLLLTVKKDHVPAISRFYAGAAVLSAVIGIWKMLQAVPGVSPNSDFRAHGYMNAVRYGEVMSIALLFILARIIYRREEDSKKERVLYWAAAVPVLSSVILSQTRGAYLGLAVGVICLFFFARGFRLKTLALTAALAAVVGATALLNPAINQRFTSMAETASQGKTSDEAINIRLELWKLGVTIFRAHPVFGIGPDNIKPSFTRFKPELIAGAAWGSLHNLYLHQAAERGLVGLGALLFLFLSLFLFAFHLFRAAPGPFTLWAVCVLPAYYVMNITEISFQHVHTSFAVFMALAFASAYSAERPELK